MFLLTQNQPKPVIRSSGYLFTEKVVATIRTSNERIEGAVFILPDTRLLDLLNKQSQQFIPVSEAKVFSEDTGKLLYEVAFMAVNTSHIITLTEVVPPDAGEM